MKQKRLIILMLFGLLLAACRNSNPINPDLLPANYNYAGGSFPNPITLNGVTVRIEEPRVEVADANLKQGYVYLVVHVRVSNQSSESVNASEFRLIDEYLNLYESWQTSVPFADGLTPMPQIIAAGQTAEGEHVFLLPAAALQANLRLRWQSAVHQSRIDLSLGTLSEPLPEPQ